MASEGSENVLQYFRFAHSRADVATKELTQLASDLLGDEAETELLESYDESKLQELAEKIKLLDSEFMEQLRLEDKLKRTYGQYCEETSECMASITNEDKISESANDHSIPSDDNLVDPVGSKENGTIENAENAPVAVNPPVTAPVNEMPKETLEILLLTDAEFAQVPKYLKNRLTVGQVNVIASRLNAILENKYRILAAGIKGNTTKADKDKLWKYRSEQLEDGRRCCMEEDLRGVLPSHELPLLKSVIPILRHCKRIKDERCGKATRLILLPH